jgi:hypothetical protein
MRSVPQSDFPQSPFLWSRGTAARETLRYLDRNGTDAEPMDPREDAHASATPRGDL